MTQTTTMIGGIKEESEVEHNWQQHASKSQAPQWYLRWRWIAKILTTVNEITPKCEAKTDIFFAGSKTLCIL